MLRGSGGADVLMGPWARDRLRGEGGDDRLNGGGDADWFEFRGSEGAGLDVVEDLDAARIDFS